MQISPIEKNTDKSLQSKTFKKVISSSKRKHYDLLSFNEALFLVYRREGFAGYYRGFLPACIKNTLNAGTYFSSLHMFVEMLDQMNVMSERQNQFAASSLARVVQSVCGNPVIVIKTRLEVLGFNEYNGMADACRKIYRNEGMGGFFTGLKISLIRDVPFSGIFYPIYEGCKSLFSLLLMFNP